MRVQIFLRNNNRMFSSNWQIKRNKPIRETPSKSKLCCGCEACEQRCPNHAISLHYDEEGFLIPQIDAGECSNCGLCEKVCPVLCVDDERESLCIGLYENDDEVIRKESSSGGFFSTLARKIIDDGGVVFGAVFDDGWNVVHGWTDNVEGLASMRGSKYVQSRINNAYIDCERFLKQGRKVLFSGTPCQIAALRRYLRKNYSNLLLVDFICHGVPSPGVWREYLKELQRPKGAVAGKNTVLLSLNDMSTIRGISFREKRNGWEKYGFAAQIGGRDNDRQNSVLPPIEYYAPLNENPYLRGFIGDLFLRPSCYQCEFKSLRSGADITMGDAWGVWNYKQCDDKGTTLVIASTSKGREYAGALLTYHDFIDKTFFRKHNPAIYKSPKLTRKRKLFFKQWHKQVPLDEIITTCFPPDTYLDKLWWSINKRISMLCPRRD